MKFGTSKHGNSYEIWRFQSGNFKCSYEIGHFQIRNVDENLHFQIGKFITGKLICSCETGTSKLAISYEIGYFQSRISYEIWHFQSGNFKCSYENVSFQAGDFM